MYSRDLIGQILADSPKGNVMETKFKGLADIVLAEAKLAGCSYADVRFTMNSIIPGGTANFRAGAAAVVRGGRRRRRWRRWWWWRRWRWWPRRSRWRPRRAAFRPTPIAQAGGFGVRVIHSGVWGFASQPDRDRRRNPSRHARRDRSRQGQRDRQEEPI